MSRCQFELTLADALSDPLVTKMMVADGVDPRALEACFSEVAGKIRKRRSRR